MLEQCCNHSKQYRNNVATPCCGLREKSWLRIRVNVRIFNRSKIRPVDFLTFSLLSLSRHRKFPLECQVYDMLLLFTNPKSATGRSKAVGAGRRKDRRGKNREVCWDVAMRILYISGLSVSQLEIWNSEVSIVYNVDKFFSELTQVSMLAGYCSCWIVLTLFNFQTVSFSAGVPVTSIIEMAISYNYEYLAMFTDTGLLWIGSADLQVGITLLHCLARKFSYQRTSSSS